MEGQIIHYNPARLYGFIQTPAGHSYFFHITGWRDRRAPMLGAMVQFIVSPPIDIRKKPQAMDVKFVTSDEQVMDLLAGKVDSNAEVR